MLTPNGQSGDKTDKIMLLSMWANQLKKEFLTQMNSGNNSYSDASVNKIILAGMGRPTYPANIHIIEFYIAYWIGMQKLIKAAQTAQSMISESLALDYGNGQGDIEPRTMMATAMTAWYETPIEAENILFTVGGAGALRIIFETFNELYKDTPNYRVLTPFPHYTLYADNKHQLHPIDVMKESGYQLTAEVLEESILSAYALAEHDGNEPKVLLLSNPSNPLGTVISETEMIKIAEILQEYPQIKIVIDEAYAEMYWDGKKTPSILKLAPHLKERCIILRSATKGLSAAGERLAMLMAFDPTLMGHLCDKSIATIGHAPRSAQLAYAYAMSNFDEMEHENLKNYYKPKVDYVYQRATEMGAAMPDPQYQVEGTFYVLCDLSDLFGTAIPADATRALGYSGTIQTSEELVYSLLFTEHLMVAPGEYFGMPANKGFVRITCSDDEGELKELMDRLENRLIQARIAKRQELLFILEKMMNIIPYENESVTYLTRTNDKIKSILNGDNSSMALKIQNEQLSDLLSALRVACNQPEVKESTPLATYSFLSAPNQNRHITASQLEWKKFVDNTVTAEGTFKNYLLNLDEESKKTYTPWLEHLKTLNLKGLKNAKIFLAAKDTSEVQPPEIVEEDLTSSSPDCPLKL